MKEKFLAIFVFASIVLTLLPAVPTSAATFDPGYLLPDQVLFDTSTMELNDIDAFLQSHEGVLKNYYEIDIDGLLKTAAMIVSDAAQRNNINPQYLLILLQKEQGLITNPQPKASQLDWATGYAACDRCDVSRPELTRFKGFAKQVDQAAWRTRYFIEHPQDFTYQVGADYVIDGQPVTVKNRATAALYNYTPHLHGNQILWKLYQYWFAEQARYPEGTLLQVYGDPGIWLISKGQRHAFTNEASFTSRYRFDQVVQVLPAALEQYPAGGAIRFPDFALVQDEAGKIYLLSGKWKRWITDDATFKQFGFTTDEVLSASADDLSYFDDGEPIDGTVLEPLGALLQDPDTYGIYYVQNGVKYPLIAPELLSLNFSHLTTRRATRDELDRYPKGAPIGLHDGLLVKSAASPTVYVISNGQKLPINSEFTFNSLGYHWENIQTVSEALLALHPTGEPLVVQSELTDQQIQDMTTS